MYEGLAAYADGDDWDAWSAGFSDKVVAADDGSAAAKEALINMDSTYADIPNVNTNYVLKFFKGGKTYTVTIRLRAYGDCKRDANCPAYRFKDFDLSKWYHDGIHFCVENSYMNGASTTSFDPYGDTTRGQIVAILYRIEGEPAFMNDNRFTDVKPGSYYEKAIVWASGKGIVEGFGNGTFGPDKAITREQLATILWRYAKYKSYDVGIGNETNILSYDDVSEASLYALPALQWACRAEIVNGKGSSLVPKGAAYRCEAAAMIQRFCNNVAIG